jgi:hypothetical protein
MSHILTQSILGETMWICLSWQVSRTFLQAGAAAGTVARSISAYDMKMSDVNYGKASLGLELTARHSEVKEQVLLHTSLA